MRQLWYQDWHWRERHAMTMPLHPATTAANPVDSLPAQALKYLGLHPDNPATYALALLANRYQLDPLLNEISIITGKAYVTRDGMLTIAHRSGQFDGMTVDDIHEGETGWGATVTVWRKDMTHPFTYSAGCGRKEPQAAKGYGPEMALARAERRALRRAFNIPSGGDYDDDPQGADEPGYTPAATVDPELRAAQYPLAEVIAAASEPTAKQKGDEFIVPSRDQIDEVKRLRDLLPVTLNRNEWIGYIGDAVGRPVKRADELDRDDAVRLILRLEEDIAAEPFPDTDPPEEPY